MFSSRRKAARANGARQQRVLRGFATEPLESRLLLAAFEGIPAWQSEWLPYLNNRHTTISDQNHPTSGAVNAVAPHPDDANVLFVATVNGGLWRTRNALELQPTNYRPSWTPLTDRYGSLSFGDIVFDPTDPNDRTLWASIARTSSFGRDGGPRGGLLRTTDQGDTWVPMGGGVVANQNLIKVVPTTLTDPGTSAQIVLTASNIPNTGGVFRSNDGGSTFARISGAAGSGLRAAGVSDLVADPTDPNVFYAVIPSEDVDGDGTADAGEDTNGFTGNGNGIFETGSVFRSRDGGVTWRAINNGLTGPGGITTARRVRFAAARGALYAAIVNVANGQLSGVYRLANPEQDASTNWTAMGVPEVAAATSSPITGASNASPIVITSNNHGRQTGTRVRIAGVTGNTAANGDWQITRVDANRFSLDGSAGNGAYAGGGTWTALVGIHPRVKAGGQGNTHLSFVTDPRNANAIYIGGDRLGSGRNAGALWRGDFGGTPVWGTVVDSGANGTAPHADSRDMEFDARGNIIEGDDGGVTRLVNPANLPDQDGNGIPGPVRKWESLVGTLNALEVFSVRVAQGELAFGTQDNGTYGPNRRTEGSTFTTHYDDWSGSDGGVVAWDRTSNPDRLILYTSTQNFGNFQRILFDRATNYKETQSVPLVVNGAGGSSLVKTNFDPSIQFIQQYKLNAVNPSQLLVGTSYLYESMNQGDTLQSLGGPPINLTTDGLDNDADGTVDESDEWGPQNVLAPAFITNGADDDGDGTVDDLDEALITAMAYGGGTGALANAAVIYAAVRNLLFLRQSGTGQPTAVTTPGTVGVINDIILDPDDWKIAYIVDSNGRVFQTNDAAASPPVWTDLTGDLRNLVRGSGTATWDLRTIELMKSGGTRALFVGGSGGVFFTTGTAAGAHWREFGNFLPNMIVNDLQYQGNTLYAGTWGRGVWSMFNVPQYFTDGNRPTTLTVRGDNDAASENNTITLAVDRNIPNLLRITVAGGTEDKRYSIETGSLDRIRIIGGTGFDVYNIEGVGNTAPVTIERGSATSIVHIGAGGGRVQNIQDLITLTGDANAGSMRLIIDGRGDPNPTAIFNDIVVSTAANDGRIENLIPTVPASGAAPALPIPITWNATARVNEVFIYSTAVNRTFDVVATGVPTTIVGAAPAAGRDVVNVGQGNRLDTIQAPLTYRAENSRTTDIFLFNTADFLPRPVTVDQHVPPGDNVPYGRIRGLAPADISFKFASIREARAVTAWNPAAISVFGAGSATGRRSVTVNEQPLVTVLNMDLDGAITATDATSLTIRGNTLGLTTTITGCATVLIDANPSIANLVLRSSTGVTATNNTFTGPGDVTVGTNVSPFAPSTVTLFQGNTVRGTMTIHRRSRVTMRNNTFGRLVAAPGTTPASPGRVSVAADADAATIDAQSNRFGVIELLAPAAGTFAGNEIGWRDPGVAMLYQVALDLRATFDGPIQNNDIHNAVTGVNYAVASPLIGNRIFGNTTGVVVTVNSTIDGLGFHPGSGRNDIYGNTAAGVNLTGRMQNQHVHDNPTGVVGSGILGGEVFELANLIASNAVGADFDGTIQFNRFARNAVGVLANDRQVVIHNLIYRGTTAGVRTDGADDVRIVHNTFYNVAGNSVQVDGGSVRTEIVNNVFQADGGYALNVADDSRGGYFSDYNDLYTTGPGVMLRWRGIDFDDVIDLQQDIYRFDLHSIGTSAASPGFAAPRFLDVANDDFRVPPLTGNQHLSSPTIDAGAPFIDVPAPPGFRNLLVNGSFETGTTSGWVVNVGGGIGTADPFVFAGTRYFTPGGVAAGFAEQTVDLIAAGYTPPQLDGNALAAIFGGRVRSVAESPLVDEGRLLVTFLDGAGAALGGTTTITATRTTDRWELLGGRLAVPAGARSFRYRFEATRLTGTSNDAFLDATFVWLRPSTAAPDLGAFGGNAGTDVDVVTPHLQVLTPTLYADWEAADPHVIEWQTFGNTSGSPVRIQVFKDGAGAPFPITITASTPDTGRFTWIPEASGLTPGTKGLRIDVSLVSDPSVSDRSAEPFALPEAGHVFYVNDGSLVGDEYATAVGDNRNTGRTPGSPKPSLEALLRTYRLGAADVVYIDTGVYDHVDTIVLGGTQQVGGDQGVTITGPLDAARVARINGPGGSALFDVNAANVVNLRHLTLAGGTYAVWVRNGGSRFTGTHLTSLDASADGFRIENGVADVTLDRLSASGAGRDGVSIEAANVSLTNSVAHHNARYGIYYANSGNAAITGNESYNNRHGLNITNRVPGTTARVGDANLALALGNKFHDNVEYGIWTSAPGANITVAGNAVTNNGGSGAGSVGVGILLGDATSATGNVVSGHYRGIVTGAGPVTNNRVFDSADFGVANFGTAPLTGNVVYRNRVGIYVQPPFAGPAVRNNLVYANSYRGIWHNGGSNARVENNTVYQATGDAVRIEGASAFGAGVRNNILWTGGPAANPPGNSPLTGFAISLDAASEIGFRSDYNLLFTSGSGRIGLWEGIPAATLADWRTASAADGNSLSKPPAFVDADGADNVPGTNDDDFHEQSTAGSFHGGSLAPVISATTGLPVSAPGTLTIDPALSPAVDRGDPTFAYTTETAPSGGAINLGAYGNTAQASRSPTSYVTVLQPDGGESVLAGHNFVVRWTSQDTAGTVLIELLNGAAVVSTVAAAAPNTGSFDWAVPSDVAPGTNYFIRVSRNGLPAATDTTDLPFGISASTQFFYVNDGAFAAGDWTTAPGNDANSGLDPAQPKASIKAILAAYNLGAGDVIRVDAGTYALTTNIGITAADSGVKIEGYRETAFPARRAVLTRPVAAGAVVFDFQGADDVTLEDLALAGGGANVGIFADAGADSDRVTLTGLDVSGFGDFGLQVHGTNDNWTVANNRFHDAAPTGFYRTGMVFDALGGASAGHVIRDNVVFNFSRIGIAVENGGAGTLVTANDVYNNGTGISVGAAQNAAVTVSANKVHENVSVGILASGPTTSVIGNTAWGQAAVGAIGIQTQGAAPATGNITYGNGTGIFASGGGAVTNNRSYGNARFGIYAGTVDARGNVLYNNQTGIEGFGSPVWANNLVYGNSAFGMYLRGASAPLVINNTVYQPTGDALTVESTHNNLQFQNIRVRNNILWALSGYAFAASTDVAPGFQSDYNDLYATGTGRVGLWEGQARPTLLAWQQATFNDSNSYSVDPRFVDAAGGDFHEQSTRGSFHGGSLAPALDPATGLPAPVTATETNDAADSPAIDAGAPTDSAANEPAPNGGFVNWGAFGNTTQASKSAATWLRVTRPDGGESWSTRQTFPVLWRGDNPGTGLVDIDLMRRGAGGALTLERNIATGVANNGRFDWAIPQDVPAATDYVVRVTRRGTPAVSDASDNTFAISAGTGIYYVNDNTVLPGDWTTAPGDDANSGLDPAHPKASVSAILAAYALGPTDVIRVDRGVYLLSNNITVTTADSGVTIRGFTGDSNSDQWRASVMGDGPVRYYRFGETSGTTAADSSGNNANATYANGATGGQPGALDRDADGAAAFNGTNQHVDLGTGFNSFANGFSFEAWVYPTANQNYARFFELADGPNANNVVLYRQGTTNHLGFNVWRNGSFGTEILARNVLANNTWQHIAVTQTPAGLVTIYKDGLAVATGTTNAPAAATRTKNFLGRSNFAGDAYYAGRMDEAAFYDKVLTAAQVGARNQLALKQAILNRNSTATNAFVFDLQGADDVTIDRLAITGAYINVNGAFGADADRITLSNNEIYGSFFHGVYAGGQNEDWNVTGNRIHDNYVNVNGEGARLNVNNNIIYRSAFGSGINVRNGNGSVISGNEVFGNAREGIQADNATITNNLVHDNGGAGLVVYGNTLATGNTVYGQSASSAAGIYNQGGEVRGNTVYGNYDGIAMTGGLTSGNRVFNNTNAGISVTTGTVERNMVYSNRYGITGTYSVTVRGNLVYANSTHGIWINPANSSVVEGNTVYQPAGDALRLTLDTNNTRLGLNKVRNNILWAAGAGGYAFNVTNDVETAVASDYNDLYASGGALMGHWATVDFPSLREWAWELGQDVHSISADPQFADADGADNVPGYAGGADGGLDDDFRVRPGSPTIDAADPLAPFVSEPLPDGQRANLGNYGATPNATPSGAAQSIQVTSPNGGEKVQAGRPLTVEWVSDGLAQTRVAGLINIGGDAVPSPTGDWGDGDSFATTKVNFITTFVTDRTGVTDAAPAGVYQSLAYADSGVGKFMGYRIPVADGTYTVRLHFNEGFVSAGQRLFDVLVQGAVARANFDVYATAGTYYRAVALALPVTASGGNGINLELVNKTVNPAILSGIEVTAVNAGGVAAPTADVQFSSDGGANWATVGSAVAMDARGRGRFTFTPTVASDNAMVRVVSRDGSRPQDASDAFFQVAPAGRHFYVNDNSTAGDVFTTAVGANANSGKSPDKPMATLAAVLASYDLESGDVVHMDTGTYELFHNLLILPQDSGVRIEGAGAATGAAAGTGPVTLLDRNNVNALLFDIRSADDVTLDHLSLTGAATAVYTYFGAHSDRVTVTNNDIYGNPDTGIFVGTDNDRWTIVGNRVHDSQGAGRTGSGISFTGNFIDVVVRNNVVFNNPRFGIILSGNYSSAQPVAGNLVYGNGTGIASNCATVSGNEVHHNTVGIVVSPVSSLLTPSAALDNLVYSNGDGIVVTAGDSNPPVVVAGNRVFNHTGTGIAGAGNAVVRNNTVYSNRVGIVSPVSVFYGGGQVSGNVVYANADRGVTVSGNGVRVMNNTVYQLVGDAVRVQGAGNVAVYGNILWVEGGASIYVAADGQNGFKSDSNLLFRGPGASAFTGFWGGASRASLADWQAASGQDARSVTGNPVFVDLDGADNVLGYNPAGNGYDGGADDDFYLSAGSPAIDRGYSYTVAATDLEGFARVDDPGTANNGSPDLSAVPRATSAFAQSGTLLLRANNAYAFYDLPFAFPLLGSSYTRVMVSTEGYIQFEGPDFPSGNANGDAEFLRNRRVAPMWDNINVSPTLADGVFVDATVAGQVKFTWRGVNEANGQPVNFSAVLMSDGRMRFDYGAGNTGLTPTAGVSFGDGLRALRVAGYDGAAALTNAPSVDVGFVPGFVDVGAYEFRGSSGDTTPPTVTATVPAAVGAGGAVLAALNQPRQITLTFSEAINSIDARAAGNFVITGAGRDGVFGTADDLLLTAVPRYVAGARDVSLDLAQGFPEAGIYRLTVFGSVSTSVHDLSGLRLDGNGDGAPGGDYVRTFTVAAETVAPTVTAVWVGSQKWTGAFGTALQVAGLGSAQYGYAVVGGAGQLLSLPWSNMDRVTVRFSEAVTVSADDLSIGGSNVADYGVTSFTYDPATFTATWTLQRPPSADKLLLRVDGGVGGVRDLAGNRLDGDWANLAGAGIAGQFPSGNGAPGGDLLLRINVLGGDVTRDLRTNAIDLVRLRSRLGTTVARPGSGSAAYSVLYDINGDGRINVVDVALVRAFAGRNLTGGEPSAPPGSSAAAVAASSTPTYGRQAASRRSAEYVLGTGPVSDTRSNPGA